MIIQFFSNYPDRAPLIYIYPYGGILLLDRVKERRTCGSNEFELYSTK